jgi:hypothetical protein
MNDWMKGRKVILVEDHELGMQRAIKQAFQFEKQGQKTAFDLSAIRNRNRKAEFILKKKPE